MPKSNARPPILRCTAKLLAEIDDELQFTAADPSSTPFGDWYGHIFTVERRKCIMFINRPTLFVCPALGVVKADYRQIVPFFRNVLAGALRIMRFSKRELDWVLDQQVAMQIGRATDRSAMGSLNNRITDTKTLVPWLGNLDVCDIAEITTSLNETPMKPIGYSKGVEQMRELVAKWMR